MKNLDYYMSLPYREVIETSPEGVFVGSIPDLPGCLTQGDTLDETAAMLADAKRCWIECRLATGDPVPEPRKIELYDGRFTVEVPASMHKELAQKAKTENVSLSELAALLFARGLRQTA